MSLVEAVGAGSWAAALAAGAVVAREDAGRRRIPNAALAAWALAVAAAWGVLLAASVLAAPAAPPWAWHRGFAVHSSASAAASLALWRAGVWPAGDAKLFILMAWVLPLAEPARPLGGARLLVGLLLAVFVPAGALFLARGLAWVWHTRLRHDAGFFRSLSWTELLHHARERNGRLAVEARAALAGLAWDPGRHVAATLDAVAMAGAAAGAFALLPAARGPLWALGFFAAWDAARRVAGRAASAAGGVALVWGALARGASVGELAGQGGLVLACAAAFAAARSAAGGLLGTNERLLPAAWLLGPLVGLAPLAFFGGLGAWAWWGLAAGAAWWAVEAFLAEEEFTLPPERVTAGLVLAASTAAAAFADPDFGPRHLARLYPDGLSARQARALRGWARRRELKELAFKKTRPFAAFILAGGALTAFGWAP